MVQLLAFALLVAQPTALPPPVATLSVVSGKILVERKGSDSLFPPRSHRLRVGDRLTVVEKGLAHVVLDGPGEMWKLPDAGAFVVEAKALAVATGQAKPIFVRKTTVPKGGPGAPPKGMAGAIRGPGAWLTPAGAVPRAPIEISWSPQSQIFKPVVEVIDARGRLLWKQSVIEGTKLRIPESVTPPGRWVLVLVSSTEVNEITASTLVAVMKPEQLRDFEREERDLRSALADDPVVLGHALGRLWAEARLIQRFPEALDLVFGRARAVVLPVGPGAVVPVHLPLVLWPSEQRERELLHGRWLDTAGFGIAALAAYRRARDLGLDEPELVEAIERLEAQRKLSNVAPASSDPAIRRLVELRDRKVYAGEAKNARPEAREILQLLQAWGDSSSEEIEESKLWLSLCERQSRNASGPVVTAQRLAEILKGRGQMEEAEAMGYYEVPLEEYKLSPENAAKLERLSASLGPRFAQLRALSHMRLSNSYNLSGNALAASAQLRKAIDLLEASPSLTELSKLLLSRAHSILGALSLLVPIMRTAQAEQHLIRACELNADDLGHNLGNLLLLYVVRPDFQSEHVRRLIEEARTVFRATIDSPNPAPPGFDDLAASLIAALMARSEPAAAIQEANRAVRFYEARSPHSDVTLSRVLISRGTCRLAIDDVFGALADLERAAAIDYRQSQPLGPAQFGLVIAYLSLGRYEEARSHAATIKGLQFAPGDPSAAMMRRADAAIQMFLGALDGDPSSVDTLMKFSATALEGATIGPLLEMFRPIALIVNGRYQDAQPLLEAQRTKARDASPGSYERLATSLNLAANLERLDRREEALEVLLEELTDTPQRQGMGARLKLNYAMLHLALKGSLPDLSITGIAEDFAVELRILSSTGNDRALQDVTADIHNFLQGVCWLTDNGKLNPSELYRVLLSLRGVATETLIRLSLAERALRSDPIVRASAEKAAQLRSEWIRAVANVSTSKEERLRLERDFRLSESVLNASLRELVSWPEERITLQNVLDRLPEETAIIEFVRYRDFVPNAPAGAEKWGQARYGAVVVTRGKDPRWVRLAKAEEIEDLVSSWLRALRNANAEGVTREILTSTEQELKSLGRTLYRRLIDPLGALPGDLLVGLDGLLNRLPLAALVDSSGRYLIEKHSVSTVVSGRDMVIERPQAEPGSPVVIASPDFSLPAARAEAANERIGSLPSIHRSATKEGEWPPLAATLQEGEFVASKLGAILLTGEQATEERFVSLVRPRVLHIATHGHFSERTDQVTRAEYLMSAPTAMGIQTAESPMVRSALILAGANNEAELRKLGLADGWATALEIAQLDLRGTELVVLSGCDTGRGDAVQSEGVFGLQRAFRFAGARSLIMSLFKVPDDSTRTLMTSFYEKWEPGAPEGAKLEALRETQLAMLKDPKTRHPRHWAGFVLMGER